MAACKASAPARSLFKELRSSSHHVSRLFARTLMTETSQNTLSQAHADAQLSSIPRKKVRKGKLSAAEIAMVNPLRYNPPPNPFITTTTCITYDFPSMEPRDFALYPSTHLLLPLRKDILHRAVIYEADASKIGTANTKWRSEIHGSKRKLRRQKGSGKARLGDRGSPMLRGGGVAFGPKPRSFATDLPKKIYDLAFRTALSHRYRQGELLLTDGISDIDVDPASAARYLRDVLRHNNMGHANGRTVFVTFERRSGLISAFEDEVMGREGKVRTVRDVDVKNLLEMGRIVMERNALEWLLQEHEDDLPPVSRLRRWAGEHQLSVCKEKPSTALSKLLSK